MRHFYKTVFTALILANASSALAADDSCAKLPKHAELQAALKKARALDNGGLNLDMWGSVVGRDGKVCAVFYTGEAVDSQWPGSRVISAQKANTANGLSLKTMALSTANLYAATQPGGFMFGIQESNPVNVAAAYEGPASKYGSEADPLVGKPIGGVNVFGGGVALYNEAGEIVGGLGVSGDTSCADHNIAWRTRNELKLDYVPGGVAEEKKSDTIIYDIDTDNNKSTSGFGHPTCGNREKEIASQLPPLSAKPASVSKEAIKQ